MRRIAKGAYCSAYAIAIACLEQLLPVSNPFSASLGTIDIVVYTMYYMLVPLS